MSKKECLNRFFKKLFELLFTGVILAVVASLLTTSIMNKNEQKKEQQRQISDISNIFIGCSSDWMNEHFGSPQFTAHKENYTLCAYISDYFVIQIAFDQGNSAKAYLITELESYNDSIVINDSTKVFSDEISLCDTPYYDLPSRPISTFGFVSNGNVRALYAEEYYYMGGGNYYTYYYATLDFGKTGGDVLDFIKELDLLNDEDVDDEVPREIINGYAIKNRTSFCPNTYGVADRELTNTTDVYSLLFDYNWFNSIQIRNKYHDTSSLFEELRHD